MGMLSLMADADVAAVTWYPAMQMGSCSFGTGRRRSYTTSSKHMTPSASALCGILTKRRKWRRLVGTDLLSSGIRLRAQLLSDRGLPCDRSSCSLYCAWQCWSVIMYRAEWSHIHVQWAMPDCASVAFCDNARRVRQVQVRSWMKSLTIDQLCMEWKVGQKKGLKEWLELNGARITC